MCIRDRVCVTVENDQVDALLDEDWRLSIWTGNQFIPVVAVIDELSWLDSSAVQLSFLTLSEDVQIRLSGSAGNS